MRRLALLARLAVLILAAPFAVSGAEAGSPTLADVAFLEGSWRGGDKDLAFEEIWSGPEAGVMTGMARGARAGALAVLEYIVLSQEDGAVLLRFHHYKADFSAWEEDPIVLRLVDHAKGDATFRNDDPQAEVQSLRYWTPSDGSLQADVGLLKDGEPAGFTLLFSKVED